MQTFEQLLSDMIAIKSISTDPAYRSGMSDMVEWFKKLLEENCFEVNIFEGHGNPIVFASSVIDPKKKTCLIYGHYDVQPAAKEDGWNSEPFTLTKKDGKYIGRGVVDNKGQVLIHIYAVLSLMNEKKLKYNIKLVIEGDEETGGSGVGELLNEHKSLLGADLVMISDGEMPYQPVLTASFRGSFNTTVRFKTAENNLHSGLYGGAVPNAAEELAKFISKLHDDNGMVVIPGFYDADVPVTAADQKLCESMDESRKEVLEKTGIKRFFTDSDGSFTKRTGFQSMLTASGFQSGYTGIGYSNIVPNTAEVRVNFRLAANQDPQHMFDLFKEYVAKNTPAYVKSEVSDLESMCFPVKVDLNSSIQKETSALLREVYGKEVLVDFCGASIPVVSDFQKVLKVDPLLVSLANDDCNMHGVNENFDVELLQKGLEFSRRFFSIK